MEWFVSSQAAVLGLRCVWEALGTGKTQMFNAQCLSPGL